MSRRSRSARPLRVALIGAGDVAGRHMPGWQRTPDAAIELVVDQREDVAAGFAGRWEVPRWETAIDRAVEDDRIDAVDICLPPALHAEAVRACVDHGKHVLVEKPLTPDLESAVALTDAVEQTDVIAMVAENWPFSTAVRHLARLRESGDLGELFQLRAIHESDMFVDPDAHAAKHPWGLDPVSGTFLLRAGIHSIALARELLGEYDSVYACATHSRGFDREVPATDIAVAARFRSGGIASMSYTGRSQHLGPRRMQLAVFGTDGTAHLDLLTGEVVYSTRTTERVMREAAASLGYVEEIEHFVDRVFAGTPPETGFRAQLPGLAAVVAAHRSLTEGRPVEPEALLRAAGGLP